MTSTVNIILAALLDNRLTSNPSFAVLLLSSYGPTSSAPFHCSQVTQRSVHCSSVIGKRWHQFEPRSAYTINSFPRIRLSELLFSHQQDCPSTRDHWRPSIRCALLTGNVVLVWCTAGHNLRHCADGFSIFDVDREMVPGDPICDGGLTFVHRNMIKVRDHPLANDIRTFTFELQLL